MKSDILWSLLSVIAVYAFVSLKLCRNRLPMNVNCFASSAVRITKAHDYVLAKFHHLQRRQETFTML